MVNAVEQRLDSVRQRCRVKAQKHLDRLGQLYELDLVDNVLHTLVESVGVRRVRNGIFGVSEYHVAQEHRCHELTVRKRAGRIPCLVIGLFAHGTFGRAGSLRTRTHCTVGFPYHNLTNTGIRLVKDQLHVGIVGQRSLANGAVHLVHLTQNAYVAQKRHMAFANEFDDITRFMLVLAKEFPDHAI